jgi:hypothetical protein
MPFNLEATIWYALLLDAVGGLIVTAFYPKWYKKNFKGWARWFAPTPGWSIIWLALILYVGYLLLRLGVLFW